MENNMNTIQCVIFDLDGTLINSLDDIGNSMNQALSEFLMPAHKIDAYKMFVGTGARNLTLNALPEEKRADSEFVEKVFARYREIYKNAFLDLTAPYEGVSELLKNLQKRNIPACILSNKPHDDTCYLAKVLFPDFSFSKVYGQRENVPKKPNPAGALLIAKELSVLPENTLYVGDSGVDMQTGKAAGDNSGNDVGRNIFSRCKDRKTIIRHCGRGRV
jgi:phosphoglycolate phosphatase